MIQYVLTPKGIAERTKLTINFMARKMKEYDELKKELKNKMWTVIKIKSNAHGTVKEELKKN